MATAKDTYYAWTDIVHGDSDGNKNVMKAGSKVSESDFSEDDWAQLVEARSVRKQQFPDMPADYTGSPREFVVQQVQEQLAAAEDMLSDDDMMLVADQSAEGDNE